MHFITIHRRYGRHSTQNGFLDEYSLLHPFVMGINEEPWNTRGEAPIPESDHRAAERLVLHSHSAARILERFNETVAAQGKQVVVFPFTYATKITTSRKPASLMGCAGMHTSREGTETRRNLTTLYKNLVRVINILPTSGRAGVIWSRSALTVLFWWQEPYSHVKTNYKHNSVQLIELYT